MRSFAYAVEPQADFRSSALAARLFGPKELHTLKSLARRLTPVGFDADDLLHDGLERALRNIDRFEPGTNLCAWMRTILTRLAVDRVRARQRQRTDAADVDSLPDVSGEEGEAPPWAGLEADDLRAAVDGLPERMAATFRLWAFEGLPYDEIARRLGLPPGTVASRLKRAREQLKKRLVARQQQRRAPLSLAAFARSREAAGSMRWR